MRRAFVSHSSVDDSFVAELESFLRASGFDEVFNDVHAVKPDEQFWPKIEESVRNCDTFYVVITAASNNSEWVTREVRFARQIDKRVVPVWREDCQLPSEFSDRDVIDFRPRIRKERRFDISRILKFAPAELIGREDETTRLSDAWQQTLRLEKPRPHVLTFVALGGEGKTSLVAKWAVELAAQDWPGCDSAFAWSFYSQGSSETQASSSDLFLKEALKFFAEGDPKEEEIKAFASSPAGVYEKGQRLARLVGQRRSLLILDGLEPLQYAPTSPTPGELKDHGIATLLKGLAQNSHGLCLVTTRYSFPDLKAFWKTTAPAVKLLGLSREAGVHLLKTLGVKGTAQEFEKLVEDVKGHALTLTLMGSYLRDAHSGDIRKRNLVKIEEADIEEYAGHTFRVMQAYEEWLESGERARPMLAMLRLMGLFDRPATVDCLRALWAGDAIAGLTESLVEITEAQRNLALKRLEDARLLTVTRDATGALLSLDAHPHIREYFGKQLREQHPNTWCAGHKRLYEHLCKHEEGNQPTLEDLQPLYQAIVHGCQAGLQQESLDKVFWGRVHRAREAYSVKKLGALGSDLGGIACFFEQPWSQVSPVLIESDQGWLLNQTAFNLQALGRLTESLEPMRTGMKVATTLNDWRNAAKGAGNLSELKLTLGAVAEAVADAKQSVIYADSSIDAFGKGAARTVHANTLHQAGCLVEARAIFENAEQMQAMRESNYPLLYSMSGFQYCDLLLGHPQLIAWRAMLQLSTQDSTLETAVSSCCFVSRRVAKIFEWRKLPKWDFSYDSLLSITIDHVTLGRAALYEQILTKSNVQSGISEIELAVSGLRRTGRQDYLPCGLFTRAWFRVMTNDLAGAQADLDEAWEITERGPMRLHMADIHLHRARLFFREPKYPWESPEADLKAAEELINKCGYHRRDEELADAKRAILGR